jgi:hypothetical protein
LRAKYGTRRVCAWRGVASRRVASRRIVRHARASRQTGDKNTRKEASSKKRREARKAAPSVRCRARSAAISDGWSFRFIFNYAPSGRSAKLAQANKRGLVAKASQGRARRQQTPLALVADALCCHRRRRRRRRWHASGGERAGCPVFQHTRSLALLAAWLVLRASCLVLAMRC